MTLFFEITGIVFPVFLIMAIGYGLRRIQFLDALFIQQANRLVFHICLPLLLVYKIGTSDFGANFNLYLLLTSYLTITTIMAISYAYAHWRGYPPNQSGVFCQGSFRANMAIVGLAIIFNAYGNEGLTRAGILMGLIVPFLNFFSVLILLFPHARQEQFHPLTYLKQILLNPLIIGSLIGIAWSLLEIPLPQVLDRTLDIFTSMTLPLALLCIGAGFTFQRLQGDLWQISTAVFFKNILLPCIAALYFILFHVHNLDFAIGVLLLGSPTAAASYIMASQMKGDSELAGAIIVLSTLLSILTYSLILAALALFSIP